VLTRRVIPCLDVRDGRVVKGVRFQGLRDAGDPAELAARYQLEGADELVLLDVSATGEGRLAALETVAKVRRALSIPLTVGGGVGCLDDATQLLGAGADRIGINTAAVRQPGLIREAADRFGTQCIVVAIDAARSRGQPEVFEVVVCSGRERTGLDAVAWAGQAAALGAGEVLLTSWDRDGTQAGYALALIKAVSNGVSIPVIASGGAGSPEDLLAAFRAGADAVLAASIFHDGRFSIGQVKEFLAQSGMEIRR
jgi:imidazole glycerol-phosphate synthase subunit HisF